MQSHNIYNSQKVETAQMSINGWMDKQNVDYPYDGTLFSHKKNEVPIYTTAWINLKNTTLSEWDISIFLISQEIPRYSQGQDPLV